MWSKIKYTARDLWIMAFVSFAIYSAWHLGSRFPKWIIFIVYIGGAIILILGTVFIANRLRGKGWTPEQPVND